MTRYTIAGHAYDTARDAVNAYGCSTYTADDWQELAETPRGMLWESFAEEFPDLEEHDWDELTRACQEVAQTYVRKE